MMLVTEVLLNDRLGSPATNSRMRNLVASPALPHLSGSEPY
jgi:hypothetical protein